MSERDIQTEILRWFARPDAPQARIWRNNVGAAVPVSVVRFAAAALRKGNVAGALAMLDQARPIAFGVEGAADLSGILATGRRLEIEVKSETGRQRPQQKLYEAMIQKHNGLYVLARSVSDVERALSEGA
jgi:hypothetical protein